MTGVARGALTPAVLLLLLAGLVGSPGVTSGPLAAQEAAVVRGILFYSPTCPHCHDVINESLPPILDRYGDRLQIAGVDASTELGNSLYRAVIEHFDLPRDRRGVPMLVVGKDVLIGSTEIPALLPLLVDRGLAAGGIDWPGVEAIRVAMGEAEGPTRESEAAVGTPPPTTVSGRFMLDPVANSISVLVLLGLLGVLWKVGGSVVRTWRLPASLRWPAWTLPVLTLVGMGVAAYMAYVEVTGAEAVCGPMGDCNTVQHSPYARLLGVVPVAVLGLVGYAGMLGAWVVGMVGGRRLKAPAFRSLWVLALLGTLFSVYLTALEPFVIGATCAWCLTSAVVTGLILVAVTPRTAVPTVRRG